MLGLLLFVSLVVNATLLLRLQSVTTELDVANRKKPKSTNLKIVRIKEGKRVMYDGVGPGAA